MTMNRSRILIVEDEVVVAMDIEARLRSMGYDVAGRVDTGEGAIAMAADRVPDLVLMDIRLKGPMDGIDAAKVVRVQSEIPVVFLTAHADERTIERAKLSEPFGYILKPFDDRDLRTVVEMALYRRRADIEIRRVNRLYAVLSQVNRALVQVRSIPEFLEEVCRVTGEAGGVSACWVGRHYPRSHSLETAASWGGSSAEESVPVEESRSARCACARAFVEQRLVVGAVGAEAGSEGCCERMRAVGKLDVAVIPLRVRDTRWGVFSVYSERAGAFGARELALLQEVAAAIAFGVEHLGREEERQRATEEVLEQNRLFETLLEVIPAPVFVQDTGGRYLRCNEAFTRLIGRSKEGIIHRGAEEVIPGDSGAHFWQADDEIFHMGRGGVHRVTCQVQDAGGNRRDVVFHRAAFCSADGDPLGIVGVILDITDLKDHARALEASEGRYRALFETALDGFSVAELQEDGMPLRYVEANDAVCRMVGLTLDEYLSVAPADREVAENSLELGRRSQRLKDRGCLRFETRLVHKGSGAVPVEVSAHVFESGGRRFMLELIREFPLRIRGESGAVEAHRMDGARRLAGTVADDLSDILSAMLMNVGLLQVPGVVQGAGSEAVAELERLAQRAGEFTRHLAEFGRCQPAQVARVDLNVVLGGLVARCRPLFGNNIRISVECSPYPVWVDVDQAMFEGALFNLGLNAREAMPGGGHLVIGTGFVDLTAAMASGRQGSRTGRYACLRIIDDGVGMDGATVSRMFEPHFTTKNGGRGTGLGLPIALGIVEQHDGWIEISSETGKGTTVRVLLPVARGVDARSALMVESSKSTTEGAETVLLVEDTPSVRRMVGLTLRGFGYTVIEAENGKDALELWSRDPTAIDVVLTDMVMPGGMSGLELIERMRMTMPRLPAVITSGYSMELTREGRPRLPGVGFLPKPYQAEALAKMLRSCLRGAQGEGARLSV